MHRHGYWQMFSNSKKTVKGDLFCHIFYVSNLNNVDRIKAKKKCLFSMNLLPFLLTYNTNYKLGFSFCVHLLENISILIYNIEILYWNVLKYPFNMKQLTVWRTISGKISEKFGYIQHFIHVNMECLIIFKMFFTFSFRYDCYIVFFQEL